jgi:hypothetical protein
MVEPNATKSEGLTPSERYLGELSKQSFLSLWSHQNLYRKPAKELADLIVVCDNLVLIFSDKHVDFHENIELTVSWPRWYNRAIVHSVKQLKRAEGWIKNQPTRIYRDAQCQIPAHLFNTDLPLEIYKIAIANGAAAACIRHFGAGSGSLVVEPQISDKTPSPFCVGNPAGPNDFVHVFDEANLHIILRELDTICDFVWYLKARTKLIQNGHLLASASEEDLLAHYVKDINESGDHDFVIKSGKSLKRGQIIAVEEGSYRQLRERKEYINKKIADRPSYIWDRLIEKFAKNFVEGTLAPVPKHLSDLDGRFGGAEKSLRYMALESRFERRGHTEAIRGAFLELESRGGNRFFRAMLASEKKKEVAFCVLLVKRSVLPDGASFDDYREYRCQILSTYTEGLLERNRHLKRVIGIATEGELDGPKTEDLVYHEPPEWSDEVVGNLRERENLLGVFQSLTNFQKFGSDEYPESVGVGPKFFDRIPYTFIERPYVNKKPDQSLNRRQRRAAAAKSRKHE